MTKDKILNLIISKRVNVLLLTYFTDVDKYNAYIKLYEVAEDRLLTKREFGWLRKLIKGEIKWQ